MVKNLPANAEDERDEGLVRKIPWSRKWQPTLIFLPWIFPQREEPGGLQSMGSQRVRHDQVTEYTPSSISFINVL